MIKIKRIQNYLLIKEIGCFWRLLKNISAEAPLQYNALALKFQPKKIMEKKYQFLIDEVLSKFGQKVNDLSIAKKLSKEISNSKNGDVSYNTIRRFFGLINSKQHKFHTKTLNIFSRYCGHENFIEHQKFNNNNNYQLWKLTNHISFSNKKIDDLEKIKKKLEIIINTDPRRLTLLGLLTNKLLFQKNEQHIIDLYNIKIDNICSSRMLIPVTNYCNLIASSFREYEFKNPNTILELSKKETFIRLYMHYFVDYNKNNHNYMSIIHASDDEPYDSNDLAFKYLFLDTMRFFKSETLTYKGLDIPYRNLTNEFVKGRWIGIFYLRNENKFNFKEFYKSNSILLATELLVFALVKNDFATIKVVCDCYSNNRYKKLHWYHKNEKIILDLFLSLNFFMKGDKKSAFAMFAGVDIEENSNFQRLDHNLVIYLYIKIVIKGASDALELKFKSAKKTTHLDLLNYISALGLNKRFA